MSIIIVLLLAILPLVHGQAKLTRVLLKDPAALCLDGSPGAYYYDIGTDPTDIVLYFEGGGWCGDRDLPSTLDNCYERCKTFYGSSKTYPETVTYPEGILSTNENSHFRNSTRILLRYCDGSGHQGSRSEPILYKNTKMYFRGHNITVAQLEDLEARVGIFSKAKRVIVTGGSAGGLAALIWTDYIKERATTKKVYCVPDSGIFLASLTYDTSQNLYQTQFQNLFKLSNPQISPPTPSCIQAYPSTPYKCMLAQYLYKYITTPIFVIQSLYDSWAIENILHVHCLNGSSLAQCSGEEMKYIDEYRRNTTAILGEIVGAEGNGGWGVGCAMHGFLHASRTYSTNYRIPAGSANSIDLTLYNWLQNKTQENIYIDMQNWPSNRPCSGLPSISVQ